MLNVTVGEASSSQRPTTSKMTSPRWPLTLSMNVGENNTRTD
jgi:hypothetical protein